MYNSTSTTHEKLSFYNAIYCTLCNSYTIVLLGILCSYIIVYKSLNKHIAIKKDLHFL